MRNVNCYCQHFAFCSANHPLSYTLYFTIANHTGESDKSNIKQSNTVVFSLKTLCMVHTNGFHLLFDCHDPIKYESLYFHHHSPSKAFLPSRNNPFWSISASQSSEHLHGEVDLLCLFYLIWKHLETALSLFLD